MAWHLFNGGSDIEIRPGRGGEGHDGGRHYASFPEARRAALAHLDSKIAESGNDDERKALRARRDEIAAMTASDVPKEALSTGDGIEMDAAMEMVQLELAREKLARRPILVAFVVIMVAVIALLSLLNG
jgi:hypothetical protein